MKQVIKLNHKTGLVEITIEGSDENVLKYLKSRIEELFGPVEECEQIEYDGSMNSFKSLFGDAFGEIFGKGFKK